jgi:hypothetical protein
LIPRGNQKRYRKRYKKPAERRFPQETPLAPQHAQSRNGFRPPLANFDWINDSDLVWMNQYEIFTLGFGSHDLNNPLLKKALDDKNPMPGHSRI